MNPYSQTSKCSEAKKLSTRRTFNREVWPNWGIRK